jgi:Raf kinase inhibitor-like YbhB/YbcL family protein
MSDFNPYDRLPAVGSFTVTSTDVADGQQLAQPHLSGIFGAGGEDVSPQLSWSGFPAETKSFAVTCFDPDAPIPSGFWHWAVHDIPASVTDLASGAGAPGGTGLPAGAVQLTNDAGLAQFLGAAPPPGSGTHRYFFVVHALGVDTLGAGPDTRPAVQGFMMYAQTLARAIITPVCHS